MKELIKKLLGRDLQLLQLNYLKELEWAQIYHDSIRDKKWLSDLSLNIGRWAGNYPFFYALNRILNDYKPKNILELGLGESSKFISTYIDNYLTESVHTIIEQSEDWKNSFKERFSLSNKSFITILPLIKNNIKGHETNGYDKIEEFVTKKYDLYIVDGPFGSPNYSRYDIVNITQNLTKNDEFIIIFDDFDRKGEKQTFEELVKVMKDRNIPICVSKLGGIKDLAIIATNKYKFIKSI